MKIILFILILLTISCYCKSKRQLQEERQAEMEQRKANMEQRRKEFDERREKMDIERQRRREEFEKRMESINQKREERFNNMNSRRRLSDDDDSDEAVLERLQYDQFQRFKKMKEDFQSLDNLTAEEKVKNQSQLLEEFLDTQNEQDQLRHETMIRLQNKQRMKLNDEQEKMKDRETSSQRMLHSKENINPEPIEPSKQNINPEIDANIISDLEEQQQKVLNQFEFVSWGDQYPFLNHWIMQFANYQPEGAYFSPFLEKKADQLGIELDKFKELGIDFNNEIFYTGYTQFDEKLKNSEKHVTTKYQPYVACKLKESEKVEL